MSPEEKYSIDFNQIWPYIPIILLFTLYIIISIGYSTGSTNSYLPWTSVVVVSGAVLLGVSGLFMEHIHKAWVSLWILANKGENELMDALSNDKGNKSRDGDVEEGASETYGKAKRRSRKKKGGGKYDNNNNEIVKDDIFQTSRTLNLMPSAVAFICWLAYGILFKTFPTGDVVPQLIGVIWIIWLVALQSKMIASYEPFRKSITALIYICIIFLPSDSGIATKLPWYTLLAKVTIMYVLFLLLSAETEVLMAISPAMNTSSFRRFSRSVERQLSQSIWVLFVPTIFAVFAVLQIGLLIWRIFRKKPDWDKKTDTVRKRSSKKNTGKKKKHKSKYHHNQNDVMDEYDSSSPQTYYAPAIMPPSSDHGYQEYHPHNHTVQSHQYHHDSGGSGNMSENTHQYHHDAGVSGGGNMSEDPRHYYEETGEYYDGGWEEQGTSSAHFGHS